MQRRLLIISPLFAPTNAADSQRVRMYAPYLEASGWTPVIVAVHPDDAGAQPDAFLADTLPPSLKVHRARLPRWPRVLGDTIGRRALLPLATLARRLQREKPFDLAYLSSTQFTCFAIGPFLKRFHGLDYVLDYQDPWGSRFYQASGIRPPGGPVRHAISRAEARVLEPACVRGAAGFTTVSTAYTDQIGARYGVVRPTLDLPFGYAERDLELARARLPGPPAGTNERGSRLLYVGRGGADLAPALEALFRAVRLVLQSDTAIGDALRLRFLGTSYAPADRARESIKPIAIAHDLGALVEEQPARIPYGDALAHLLQADALILPMSRDAHYHPSKLYTYLAMRKPLLVLAQEGSRLEELRRLAPDAAIIDTALEDARNAETLAALLARLRSGVAPSRPEGLDAHTAESACARLGAFLHSLVDRGSRGGTARRPAA